MSSAGAVRVCLRWVFCVHFWIHFSDELLFYSRRHFDISVYLIEAGADENVVCA